MSFKKKGDALEFVGTKVRETKAGTIIRGGDGISRLFVKDIKPLIKELMTNGFGVEKVFEWSVKGYNIPRKEGRFIGITAKLTVKKG